MRTLFLGIAATLLFIQLHAQESYNSICVYNKDQVAETFLCTQIDSICFTLTDNTTEQGIWFGTDRQATPVSDVDSILFFNPYVEQIVQIEGYTGEWDKAFVTPIGYFCYKASLPYAVDDIDSDMYEMHSYVSFDKRTSANIVFLKETHLPVWFATNNGTLYFEYPEDNYCILSIDDNSQPVEEKEFTFALSEIDAEAENMENELKTCLLYLTAILEGQVNGYPDIAMLTEAFKSLLHLHTEAYTENNPFLPKQKKNYVFTGTNGNQSPTFITQIYYSVVIITGKASNITANASTLEGAVRCGSSQFRNNGTYGILCDESPDNLTIEKAQYRDAGRQDKLSLHYNVNISGLKPNTQYYYTAYFKINEGQTDLVIKYNNEDGKRKDTYGSIKRFVTLAIGVSSSAATHVTDKSAVVECTYTNVPDGAICGVEYSWNDNSARQTTDGGNGTRTITLSGLKPSTTYAYRAYVEVGGESYYGNTQTFTTNPPDISGSWMCEEEYFTHGNYNDPKYKHYTIVLNEDGSAEIDDGTDYLSASWSLMGNEVKISGMTIATQTQNSGVNFKGKLDSLENPTAIKGTRYTWNSGSDGYYEGNAHSITMTRQ